MPPPKAGQADLIRKCQQMIDHLEKYRYEPKLGELMLREIQADFKRFNEKFNQ